MTTPGPQPLSPQASSRLQVAWAESIEDGQRSTSEGMWSYESQSATLVIQINWSDRATAIPQILGYATKSQGGGAAIARVLPMAHPDYPWLYAVQVSSMRGVGYTGPSNPNAIGQVAGYQRMNLTVVFRSLPFDVKADGLVAEWKRYIEKRIKPSTEFLTTNRGAWIWGNGPSSGSTISGGLGTRVSKALLQWTQYLVPDTVINDSNAIPWNLLQGLSCVNLKQFENFVPGVLRAEPAELVPVTAPCAPALLGLPSTKPPRLWTVIHNWIWFDPPHSSGLSTRGHNLRPLYGDANGYWYQAVTKNQGGSLTGGVAMFPSYDYPNFFSQVEVPNPL